MKTLTKITLFGAALSIILHAYLAFHYYPIKFGFSSGPSMCNVSATFDCDAVAASTHSAVFGIPLAVWGAAANLILFFMVLGQWIGWSDHPERLRRWGIVLAGSSVLASLIMGIISATKLNNYCLICIALYALSVVVFEAYRRTLQEPFFSQLGANIGHFYNDSKGIAVGFVAIPVVAYVIHYSFLEAYGVAQVGQVIQRSIADWKSAPEVNFTVPPALTSGPEKDKARMTITEFADFRCSHCKHAMGSLENFLKAHPDVRFEYYNFALDGTCNEVFKEGNNLSCQLAASIQCANKQDAGWRMHHSLFSKQDELVRISVPTDLEQAILSIARDHGVDTDSLAACMKDPMTKDQIRLQAKQGVQAGVQGTPTIYVNGRQLPRGQLIPVLEAAKEASK